MTPTLVIGREGVVAIEAELEEPIDEQWVFGHFRLRFPHATLGDWDDVVTLRAVCSSWQRFGEEDRPRWDERLRGLPLDEVYEVLRASAYDDEQEIPGAYERFHVNSLGMSAFDPYIVLLIEPPGEGQRLIWRQTAGAHPVQEAWLPDRTLQQVGAEFVTGLRKLIARGCTKVSVALTREEKRLLAAGLNEWLGPAHPTEELARALGFDGLADLYAGTQAIRKALEADEALSPFDWARALAATEVVFASDVFGSGHDWPTTTGLSDVATIELLRGLQSKLVATYGPVVGTLLGRRPSRGDAR